MYDSTIVFIFLSEIPARRQIFFAVSIAKNKLSELMVSFVNPNTIAIRISTFSQFPDNGIPI
jgi:hypothetical protein